ncbi:hypothetical protein ABEB36_001262 [Hypothenemus hampei]|uniref:ENTH domain-containing protein n=1 Tax=Hypothenemus hampei TaxID=57062 RepID=A0ABD1FEV8_HYPHA
MAGQTINDRFLAARHSIAGQGLAKAVCKATTEEMIAPKKKHLDYLVHCTNEPNVSIPQLANLVIERSQNNNWVVVYKALVTCHHMMCYGNDRFTQYLASNNSTFQLNNFLDKGGLQGILNSKPGYDMSPFIRRYARYLNERALSYRCIAFDFCKIKRGTKEAQFIRTMNADRLLRTIPTLHSQLCALLEFDCNASDLNNGIINMSFMLLFRDLIKLFACYNDAIINLLEKYFDMNKKQCKEALEIYKKFLIKMDHVAEFLKVAETVGIDKGDIPDLTKAPNSLLDALEQHYNHLEGKKSTNSNSSNSNNQKNVRSGVSVLNTTSNAFGNVASSGRLDATNGIDENLKIKVLAEEEAAMNQFKSKVSSPNFTANNPFLSSSSSSATISNQSTPAAVDLFSADVSPPIVKASDDLLQLSNPFIDSFGQPNSFSLQQQQQQQQQTSAWVANTNGYGTNNSGAFRGAFVSGDNFVSVFGNTEVPASGTFDPLGGVLQPMNSNGQVTNGNSPTISNPSVTNGNQQSANNGGGLLTGDLESSLASLAENLTINDRKQTIKGVQWNSPKNSSKPSWTPQPMSATTGIGYKPMNQQLNNAPFTASFTPAPIMAQPMYPQMTMKPMVPMMTPINQIGGLPQQPPALGQQQQQQQQLLFH